MPGIAINKNDKMVKSLYKNITNINIKNNRITVIVQFVNVLKIQFASLMQQKYMNIQISANNFTLTQLLIPEHHKANNNLCF